MAWTRARLEELARERLQGAKMIVVANREPYVHVYEGEGIRCLRPASGLTTALDPVMRACGGVWFAHGSGGADRAVVDHRNCVAVPPEEPAYSLRRVWLSGEEEQGYYYGFANEALWPLCHIAYARPHFRLSDWEQYCRVNRKFAAAVVDEVGDDPAFVFVQDYHFALLPRMLKSVRSDLVVAQFWHIPWPNRETFRVCPWHNEILEGLLGNDLLSFHTQYHCNNFLDTVDRGIESRVDMERFSVTLCGHVTNVRPQPISIDPELAQSYLPDDLAAAELELRQRLQLRHEILLVGVDRVDYTKGIPERFRAFERLLTLRPQWKGKVSFVQVGAPSRVSISAYQKLNDELRRLADDINARHAIDGWKPVIFVHEHQGPEQIFLLNRIATGCVVSSLHDGMNLVAKEFVAVRDDLRGVLVLSRFTGAAHELDGAMLINPFAVDEFAESLHQALTMTPEEQERRMLRMRQQVRDNNVYRWAGMLLSDMSKLADVGQFALESA